jgi:error-prone DNA polymerase
MPGPCGEATGLGAGRACPAPTNRLWLHRLYFACSQGRIVTAPRYAELQATSNFSFLRGGSHPDELVAAAALLGHDAIALTDRNTLAGIVRAHKAAKEAALRFVVGVRLDLVDAPSLLCYPTDRAAYARFCRLLTLGKRRAGKGECRLAYGDVAAFGEGQIVVALPPEDSGADFAAWLRRVAGDFGDRGHLAAQHLYRGDDAKRMHRLAGLAQASGLPLVATNDVLYHTPERRALQDVVTCIREGCTLAEAGLRLEANAERHLKTPAEMVRLFRDHPEAVARSSEIARRCRFNLDDLRYEYPDEITSDGRTPQQELEHLAWKGASWRYPAGIPAKVRDQIAHELRLIATLGYAPYFLTVHDVVRYAESREILCQGRGSAANSAVCYCLGVTAVDPARIDVLFERFLSAARNEPPDIDVDFEHERREEVIQHIYEKYGRHRAGLAATVICYRSRGALREVAKVFGLSTDVAAALSGGVWGWSVEGISAKEVRALGMDPTDPTLRRVLDLARELIGFPRHLSQHVGGFVMTRGRLDELVPIENATMADRTVIEWDKDDIDVLGILKVDVLALGMLTCIRKAFDLIARHYGRKHTLANIPAECPEVYEMLRRADSVGVFQVESRAQMTMLPRLKPRRFYDLVIEVAIVRPGPIQGDMVHPYLRRRNDEERVEYPSDDLRQVLEKTLGVPLFQEQAMKIAIVGAGFTPAEADQLRRAMATFRNAGTISRFRDKLIEGMVERGYQRDFATRCFQQIEGFGTYGFPESHAASFALLVYVSAWIKRHYPEIFAAALLNAQPMGFYAPAQLVRDAREHDVEVLPPDINVSQWDCTLEPLSPSASFLSPSPAASSFPSPACGRGQGEGWSPQTLPAPPELREPALTLPLSRKRERASEESAGEAAALGNRFALRLGFRQIKGMREDDAIRVVERRGAGYASVRDLWRRSALGAATLERLAHADAFRSLGLDRRRALWAVKGLGEKPLPLFAAAAASPPTPVEDTAVPLPEMPLGEHVAEDYATLSLSLKRHPLAFLRDELDRRGMVRSKDLLHLPVDRRITIPGLVFIRQRPGTASGVIFMTIEDEFGVANLIVWPTIFERFRRVVLGATLVACTGKLQREGLVIHVVAEKLVDLTHRLAVLREGGLEVERAPADEERHPPPQKPRYPGARDIHVQSRDFR